MPEHRKKKTREYYLASPFGHERWIADRYNLPFERVKSAFQEMELCEFAGSTVISAEMYNDWPPPLDIAGKRHPPLKKESPLARVIRTKDLARSPLANGNFPGIKVAVDRALAIEARRARAMPFCCSFCGKTLERAGSMLESQDWQHPDHHVRICRLCAEMATVLIDFDTEGQAGGKSRETSSRGR